MHGILFNTWCSYQSDDCVSTCQVRRNVYICISQGKHVPIASPTHAHYQLWNPSRRSETCLASTGVDIACRCDNCCWHFVLLYGVLLYGVVYTSRIDHHRDSCSHGDFLFAIEGKNKKRLCFFSNNCTDSICEWFRDKKRDNPNTVWQYLVTCRGEYVSSSKYSKHVFQDDFKIVHTLWHAFLALQRITWMIHLIFY